MFCLMVVDDEEPIREMMADALTMFGYQVVTAIDGVDALEKLEKTKVDLIISDINMPRMAGFELLKNVEKLYPTIKRALITAYNLDDYMHNVLENNIGNVITKTAPFNFDEVKNMVSALLEGNIFGLDRYMLHPSTQKKFSLTKPNQIDDVSAEIAAWYSNDTQLHKFRTVLIELMTNALFYGSRREAGDSKHNWDRNFTLPDDLAVNVTFGVDREKVGVSVLDRGGRLDKHTVLYWLDRQITPGQNGLPKGIFDVHGRGLFITRKYVDRFIINIEKAKLCECCIFNYFEEAYTGYKPLLINEI